VVQTEYQPHAWKLTRQDNHPTKEEMKMEFKKNPEAVARSAIESAQILTIEEKVELAKVNRLVEKKWYNLSIEFNDRASGTISLVSRSTNMVDHEYEFTNEPNNNFVVNLRKISEKIDSL